MNERSEGISRDCKQDPHAEDTSQITEVDMRFPSKKDILRSENLAYQHEISTERIIIIDGMAVVNSVVKTEKMKTCADFAELFILIISSMAKDYHKVGVVFDRYLTP